jgi:uncharacterized cupredoxin-like copper-binding protein
MAHLSLHLNACQLRLNHTSRPSQKCIIFLVSFSKSVLILLFFVALIGSIFLTACGEGGDKTLTTIDVDMTEHTFAPNEFTVPTEAEITINLNNSGKQAHEFRILVLDAKADEDVDKDGNSTLYWNAIISPGQSKSLSFTAPSEPGSYVIRCSVPGHTQAGMVGKLYVE